MEFSRMNQIRGCITHPSGMLREIDPTILTTGLSVVVCTYNRLRSLERFLTSLTAQNYGFAQLIIVDASTEEDTEKFVRRSPHLRGLAKEFLYLRVGDSLRGLPRQRNFALRWVKSDLVAFFDDDVILLPNCLGEMVRVHRSAGDSIVGVGALIQGEDPQPTLLWRLMLAFRMVSRLRPGAYERSGISIPWSFVKPTEDTVEGDWLQGAAMMWKTTVVQAVRFCEDFDGYAQGEDLDFSLRARERGKLLLTTKARVEHVQEAAGRPDPYTLGYMEIFNRYQIHRRALANRRLADIVWFTYAWTLDTLLLARRFLSPRWCMWTLRQIAGRLHATYDLIRTR